MGSAALTPVAANIAADAKKKIGRMLVILCCRETTLRELLKSSPTFEHTMNRKVPLHTALTTSDTNKLVRTSDAVPG